MGRWAPDAAGRLKAAALQLFAERGFAEVTGAEIAAAAGVSERTFFRHFKAKEDVLFEDYSGVREAIVATVRDAPAGAGARELMQAVAELLSQRFDAHRDVHRFLAAVVSREPALRARELVRDHDWAGAIAEALARRGFPAARAAMIAATTASTFRLVHDQWLADKSSRKLATRFAAAIETLAADLG